MRRFFFILVKEFRHVARDPLSLVLLVLVPAAMLALYGYALSFDVKNIRVAVLDRDNTPQSREFRETLFENVYFEPAGSISSESEANRLLIRGTVRAVFVIPRGFAKRLARGEQATVQTLIDGADGNTAQATAAYFEAMTERMSRKIRLEAMSRAGIRAGIPMALPEPRIWFNPDLQSARFLIPGLIGMLLMLSAVIATSMSIVREKERETMEQIMVSPVRPIELLAGKIVPYVIIGVATMVLILILGRVLFGVSVAGSYLMLGLATMCFLFAALSMGILISSITRTLQMAFLLSVITSLLPAIILSGLIFPIKNMPLPIRAITFLVVPRYFIAALRGVILKAAPLSVLWDQLLAMVLLGLLFGALALRRIRKAA